MNIPVDINGVKIVPFCRVAFIHTDDDNVPSLLSGHVIGYTGFGRQQLRIVTNTNMISVIPAKKVVILGQDKTQLSYDLATQQRNEARIAAYHNITTYVVPLPNGDKQFARLLGRNDDGAYNYLLYDGSTMTLHSNHRCEVVSDCDFEVEDHLDKVLLDYERSKNQSESAQPRSADPEEDN